MTEQTTTRDSGQKIVCTVFHPIIEEIYQLIILDSLQLKEHYTTK